MSFTQVDLFMSFAGVCFVSFFLAQIVTSIVEIPFARFAKKIESKIYLCFFSHSGGGSCNNGEQNVEVGLLNQPIAGESSSLLTYQK